MMTTQNRIRILELILGGMFVVSVVQAQGARFLDVWPDARSTGLGGAMTGLADDAFAAYWNPAGLGFQRGLSAAFTPALTQDYGIGTSLDYGVVSYRIPRFPARSFGLGVGMNWTRWNWGWDYDVDSLGRTVDSFPVYEEAVAVHAGVADGRIGLGLNMKYVRTLSIPLLASWPPYYAIGQAFALDLGGLVRLSDRVSLGASVDNIATALIYSYGYNDIIVPVARLGLAATVVDREQVQLRLLADVSHPWQFLDYGPHRFGEELHNEIRDAGKALGAECTLRPFGPRLMFAGRIGYREDVDHGLGGFEFGQRPEPETWNHLSIIDVFSARERHLAGDTLRSVGIGFGIGVGYKDYVRLDVSDDHLIRASPTADIRLSLVISDLLGLIRDFR